MKIFQCGMEHVQYAADLFNQYRMFYEQPSDLVAATEFLQLNIAENRSNLFLLQDDDGRVVAMRPYLYLSDLFVDPSVRRKGHAKALMLHLIAHFKALSFQRLTLETATTNLAAQRLYESLGYERDTVFLTYHRLLG